MKITKAVSNSVPIICLHGKEGSAKTTTACRFPKPLAILLEPGLPRGVTVDAVDNIGSFDAFMGVLGDIWKDHTGYQSLIIDPIDALEAMLLSALCAENRWKTVETAPYGKAYVIGDDWWRRFIRAITAIRDKHNMTIVMTCHTVIERIDDPKVPTYTSYQLRLHKRARGLIMDCCDAVFFLSEDLHTISEGEGFRERVRAQASPQRFLFTEARPAFSAKNRFGMPAKVPIPLNFDFANLAQYWAIQKD